MQTITLLAGIVVVTGMILGIVLHFVTALADKASRNEQDVRVNLDARKLRLNVSIQRTRSGKVQRRTAPGDESSPRPSIPDRHE